MACLIFCSAQEEEKHALVYSELDTNCFYFTELFSIDFDVSQKYGCEFLITQLLNKTTYLPEDTLAHLWLDSLSYLWYVFNEDRSIEFEFSEDNPDIFLYEPGNYHIELNIINKDGCTVKLVKCNMISLDKMPQINFTFTPENALFAEYFGEVVFTNLTDLEILNDSTVVWYWDMGDHFINMKNPSPVHLFSTWGDYHTTFHLKTKNGCKVSLTKTVIIEDELFFPDILKTNLQNSPAIFAITNLNTNIPQDDPNEFRTNHLFVYNEKGEIVYDQKNYDSYIKNNKVVKGSNWLSVTDLQQGTYFYSFYYKGNSKMVHYSGEFRVD